MRRCVIFTRLQCESCKPMKIVILALVIFASVWSSQAQSPLANPAPSPGKKKIVTAAQANGIYRYYKNEFRILSLGQNQLKVQFDGMYMTMSGTPNIGYASGVATIEGNVATFKPPDTQGCVITMVFLPGKLKVTQDNQDADCGFGHNVYATGTYRKVRSGKPKFDSRDY